MNTTRGIRRALGLAAGAAGVAAVAYGSYVGLAWARYGRSRLAARAEMDPLLDEFMPEYDVAERHHVRVTAPAETALASAIDLELYDSVVIHAVFRARELLLGAKPDAAIRPKGLLAQMTSLGWGVLAEEPGREIVVGAVMQPWLANVVFRALPPDQFSAFMEPGYVKIVWTLRADPLGVDESVFRTETRVATTDPAARSKFRCYWARFSPGILLIRRVMLGQLKSEAERRAQQGHPGTNSG